MRSGIDLIYTINETAWGTAPNPGVAMKTEWHRGMDQGSMLYLRNANGADGTEFHRSADNGFREYDTSESGLGPAQNITNVSDTSPPEITANAHGLITGDIVQLSSINGGRHISGLQYTVAVIDANTFSLRYMPQVVAAAINAPGGDAVFQRVLNDHHWVPRARRISSITQAQQAQITFMVDHDYVVGQTVRVVIPSNRYGMTQINDRIGTITAVNTNGGNNSITVDIDSTNFTAFTFPDEADPQEQYAQVNPVGIDLQQNPSPEAAWDNVAEKGIELDPGNEGPAGRNGDVIYWVAYSSFSVNND